MRLVVCDGVVYDVMHCVSGCTFGAVWMAMRMYCDNYRC